MRTFVLILISFMFLLPVSCFSGINLKEITRSNLENLKRFDDELMALELVEFKIQKNATANLIQWTMIAEINNDFFTVERTTDGITYTELGEVNGAGSSTEVHEYSFEDRNKKQVINYYRIKMTDYDGNVHYSDLISVDNRSSIDKEIYIKLSIEGKEVNDEYKGMVIIRYSDGTTKKMIQ